MFTRDLGVSTYWSILATQLFILILEDAINMTYLNLTEVRGDAVG